MHLIGANLLEKGLGQKDPDAGYFGTFTLVAERCQQHPGPQQGPRLERRSSCRACSASHGAEETAIIDSGAYTVE
jgi:hypothetical protein